MITIQSIVKTTGLMNDGAPRQYFRNLLTTLSHSIKRRDGIIINIARAWAVRVDSGKIWTVTRTLKLLDVAGGN